MSFVDVGSLHQLKENLLNMENGLNLLVKSVN